MSEIKFTVPAHAKRGKGQWTKTIGLCVAHHTSDFTMKLTPVGADDTLMSMYLEVPKVDAPKLVDAIDDVTGCVTEFAEALADIAYEAGAAGFRLADSRATIPLFIQWAKEFCQINVGREWDGEYLEEIQAFTEAKMAPEIPDEDFIAKF